MSEGSTVYAAQNLPYKQTTEDYTFCSHTGQTGVEMEAITGVSVALLTIWDMTKAVEKDENGQYPDTKISDIVVLKKEKL